MRGVLIAALLAVSAAFAPATADELVKVFEGNGIQNTRPFAVDGPWEIQWTSMGESFSIYLNDGAGSFLDVSASQLGPGSGASDYPKGGEYYLEVNAEGRWEVRVIKVE